MRIESVACLHWRVNRTQRINILTGSELRHTFFRLWMGLADGFEVTRTFCEGQERSLAALVSQKGEPASLRAMHLCAREQSEEDFFRLFVEASNDNSQPMFVPKGEINSPSQVEMILAARPDLIVAYGCSIIRSPLLEAYAGRIVNIHLGLSPYYRGSGTNYWPLVNGEPEYVGATFMHMDAGVDTGEIIHQIAARVAPGDTPAQIGNRLIIDMARTCRELVRNFDGLHRMAQPQGAPSNRYYKKKDFTEESVAELHARFRAGLVDQFIQNESSRRAAVELVRNPVLSQL